MKTETTAKAVGWPRFINAFKYSFNGLAAVYKNEAAFRQELILALVLIPLAIWLADSFVQTAVLLLTVFIVMITELLNSAIEAVVDRASPEHHTLAGYAKDVASAAVFVALISGGLIWLLFLVECLNR